MEHEELLEKLSKLQDKKYSLHIADASYPVDVKSILKSKIPVRKPTTRGGVYFTDTTAYKIKAVTKETSLKTSLSSLMLGPSTDFKPILIKTNLINKNKEELVTLTTHLTNAVSNKDQIELNLIVDEVDVRHAN